MSSYQHFGIVGGGAWGTALATVLCRAGRDVTLWMREEDLARQINACHENKKYLAGIALAPAIRATSLMTDLQKAEALLVVTPLQHTREVAQSLATIGLEQKAPILVCSKGIEQKTLALPTEIVAAALPGHPLCVLSGPTFACEVARDQPTAITLATKDVEVGQGLLQSIGSPHFRPYLSNDPIGAEVGGAVKNVLAIACGVVTGLAFGDNARAALITRGLAEMARLVAALGGKSESLMGLSGLGDLVLTCSGIQSRNMSLGFALGQGQKLDEVLASRVTVAEGVFSASAVFELAQKLGVEMPIVEAVDSILNRGASVESTIARLLARPLKSEVL